jgi:hypothetical protein
MVAVLLASSVRLSPLGAELLELRVKKSLKDQKEEVVLLNSLEFLCKLLNQSAGASPLLEIVPDMTLALGVNTMDCRLWGL